MTPEEKKAYHKAYYEKNKEKWKAAASTEDARAKKNAAQKEYYKKHRKERLDYAEKYKDKNKDKINEYHRKYYNTEEWKEFQKNYYQENKDKWAIDTPEKKAKKALRNSLYLKKRMNEDPIFRVQKRLRTRIKNAIRGKGCKSKKTVDLLGCSLIEAVDHIKSLLNGEMTWEAVVDGRIHIDHVVPCSSFDLSKEEEQRRCFHYKNLQPLWAIDNLKKGNKSATPTTPEATVRQGRP